MKPTLVASSNPKTVAQIRSKYFCNHCRDTGEISIIDNGKIIESECHHCQPVRELDENWYQEEQDMSREMNENDLGL